MPANRVGTGHGSTSRSRWLSRQAALNAPPVARVHEFRRGSIHSGALGNSVLSRESTVSGLRSEIDDKVTTARERASAAEGDSQFGIATTRIPAALAERMPLLGRVGRVGSSRFLVVGWRRRTWSSMCCLCSSRRRCWS
jgi:hypothetical protein